MEESRRRYPGGYPTGAYRYPFDAAARVVVGTTAELLERLEESSLLVVIWFVLFSAEALSAFETELNSD